MKIGNFGLFAVSLFLPGCHFLVHCDLFAVSLLFSSYHFLVHCGLFAITLLLPGYQFLVHCGLFSISLLMPCRTNVTHPVKSAPSATALVTFLAVYSAIHHVRSKYTSFCYAALPGSIVCGHFRVFFLGVCERLGEGFIRSLWAVFSWVWQSIASV